MKTTVNLNIQGMVFHLDEDAFHHFKQYLDSIHRHFKESPGRDEIVFDIEVRIVELFQQKLGVNKQAINMEDVKGVIEVMGNPIDFEDGGPVVGRKILRQKRGKRLYRDMDNSRLGGVCSGLGAFFNFDPTWFRIGFVVATLSGLSPLVYVILWIAVPPARTIAEKLEMFGEPVNISNIEKAILEEMGEIKDRFGRFTGNAKSKFNRR